jgi:hypothetical protein
LHGVVNALYLGRVNRVWFSDIRLPGEYHLTSAETASPHWMLKRYAQRREFFVTIGDFMVGGLPDAGRVHQRDGGSGLPARTVPVIV